jgi:S1-C subfamily serine protease
MPRLLALAVGLALLAGPARSQDIPPDTVAAVKRATAFVRVEGSNWKGSGSGFVVSANKDTVLLATNYHVVAGPNVDKRVSPSELVRGFKPVAVTAVFEGGTKNEVSAKAEVIAADPENDLAVLRVSGLKAPPSPIDYANAPKPSETMTVYTFGYPFGQALALGKASPAITVGKASVSSLRNDDDGELALVQIDGAINPGNSGGPMVDTKGRLIGVAVSRIRDAQGIGFVVPAAELDKLMKGRAGPVQLTANKTADGKLALKAEVGLIDPLAALKGATLHYVVVSPKGTKPKAGEPLDKNPDAKKVALKIEGGVAIGEITLASGDGDIAVQVVPDGVASGIGKVRSYPLTMPKGNDAVVLGAPGAPGAGAGEVDPPPGWKEYTATNKTFKLWIPEKAKPSEKTSASGTGPARITFNSLVVEVPGGLTYVVEQVFTGPRKGDRDELAKLLRDVAIGDPATAKVVRESDTKMGKIPGKEYLIERGATAVRARAFVIGSGSSLYLLRAIGPRDQVNNADTTLFLDSCRLQLQDRPAADAGGIAGGNARDAEFRDPVPEKGALVGMEFSMGKSGIFPDIKAVRAVFRVGDKETPGAWRGEAPAAGAEIVKVVAKPGYAVGAISVRAGLGVIHGVALTFMKLADGKLDPADKYDSEWVGSKEDPPTVAGGKGEAARGLIARTTGRGVSGLGFVYQETEKKGPDPKGPEAKAPETKGPAAKVDRGPRIQGGGGQEFRDATPPGGALVGLEVGLGKFVRNDVVKAVRPIYRVGDKESFGEQFGTQLTNVVKVVAKPGYAVGAIALKTGLGVDGLSITYMKLADGKLDPKDSYESEWVGGGGDKQSVKIGGDGTLVVGVLGRTNGRDVTGLGLIYSDTNKPNLDGAWPRGIPSRMQGGGNDPEFREVGPEGSVLVGLEVGIGRFVNNPVIKSVRPIFRVGDKDTAGEWHGPTDKETVKEVVKVVAKPGYAVGLMTVRTGLGMDGLSITFMKVADGKLDPKDKYESEWVGGKGGGEGKVGEGGLVIGLIGRTRPDTATGLGLLHPAPKK